MNVVLYPGAQPGHVNISTGISSGQTALWLAVFGVDPYDCLATERDPYLHIPMCARTSVRIQKA